MPLDQKKISKILAEEGVVHSARLGDKKRFYCKKCKVHVFATISMRGVPRHKCGQQLTPAWKDSPCRC